MARSSSGKYLVLLCCILFFCVEFGCGGGGTTPDPPVQPQNPVPTVSSVTPNSAVAGSGASNLTVSGAGFIASSVVEWNGAALATTYVSSTALTAQVPASNLSSGGTASVAVRNPSPGGGASAGVAFTINWPAPTLNSVTPNSANVGSGASTLTLSGSGFVTASVVEWNGAALATTYVSSNALTAQVPAADLVAEGAASIAVRNPVPGGGASATVAFTINPPMTRLNVLNVEGHDLAWDPSQQKLYVAVPSSASAGAGTIAAVDPISGSVVGNTQLDSAASGLALSDDNHYLYAVINDGTTIQRLTLPALTRDIQWSLGTDPLSGNANVAGDIKVQPGAPHTLAVSFGRYGSGSVAIFDDAVRRSAAAGGGYLQEKSLQWKPDGTELYAGVSKLLRMPVSANGVGAITEFGSAFQEGGVHLHLDQTTGYLYSDWCELVNPANGVPVGNYPCIHPYGTYLPGALSIADPTLNRFYFMLEVKTPDGTGFQLQAFDQTERRLLSTIIIPNPAGIPTNPIRWGKSGLAFVTEKGYGTEGKLYILDGAFVNPSGIPDTAAGTRILPVPTLTGISPTTATVGSGGVTLTINGHDFESQVTAFSNGHAIPTTRVSSTELEVQVPASDLASVGQVLITASNTGTGAGNSNSLPFAVNSAPTAGNQISVYNAGGNDLEWDARAGKIYVSMPGSQGDPGNAIAIVDPLAGTMATSKLLGSDPGQLSLSDDGKYLYVGINGENAIEQLTLPDFTVNSKWNLGVDSFNGAYFALDLQAAPGAPSTTAVTLAKFGVMPYSAAVVVYDGSTPRPNRLPTGQYSYSSLQWGGSSSILYTVNQAVPQSFVVLGVGPSGAIVNQGYDRVFDSASNSLHFDAGTGLVYTDAGQAIRPSDGTIVGSYGASGLMIPDSTLNRVFILGQTAAQSGTKNYTIQSFDQADFAAVSSITIENVVGTPTALIRWGSNGLAFITRVGSASEFLGAGPGQLYVISGDFASNSSAAKSSVMKTQFQPVSRTWNLGTASKHASIPAVAERSPLR